MRIGLIGGGGFAKEVAEIAALNGFRIAGYFSDFSNTGKWDYLGLLSDASKFKNEMHFAFCIGALNSVELKKRRALILDFQEEGLFFETLVSPNAVVSDGVQLGLGVIVAHSVVLSVDATIGDFCILNTNAVIGHDSKVGFNSILAPLCFLGGNVEIKTDVLVGPNSSVLEGRVVSERSIVGAGAVVHRNLAPDSTIFPVVTKTI